jgi:steroid delta-isomerase-like uncharacterized protein
MSTEANKTVVRRFTEASNTGSLAMFDELLADAFVDHSAPPGFPNDREGQKQFTMMLRTGFPDASQTIDELIAEGDKVVMRWTGRGTNRGEFMGIPATGKPVTVTGIDIFRLEGGTIVEHWSNWDMMGMMQQLGVAPTPG